MVDATDRRCKQKKRALVKPEGSTYARVGKCIQRKRALVKPEGSTYAGARSLKVDGMISFRKLSRDLSETKFRDVPLFKPSVAIPG